MMEMMVRTMEMIQTASGATLAIVELHEKLQKFPLSLD